MVVARVAGAHEGSAETALRMIDAAFRAGADAIAFEVFRAAELVVRRHPLRRELEEVELAAKDWRRILEAARGSGLVVLAEVLDVASRDLAAEAGVDGFQIRSSDLDHPDLLRALAATGRPALLATGSAREPVIADAIALAGPAGALVVGPAAAPAPPEEIRFREIAARKARYRLSVGFLDATDGGSAFALVAPALAAAHGADFVEKGFTLDRSRKGRDWAAALSPEDFYRMVELLRQAERAGGEGASPGREPTPRAPERGRSIVAASLIARGDALTAEMLAFKHTSERGSRGLPPREAHRVIGRRAARPIQADETIREDMLE
jgi:sialic acid synthase SpsE